MDSSDTDLRQRTEVLKSSGTDSDLIQHLLKDALLLEVLKENLQTQVETLQSFHSQYLSEPWRVLHEQPLDQIRVEMAKFGIAIQKLRTTREEELKKLTDSVQNIIQLVPRVVFLVGHSSNPRYRNST